MSFQTLNNPAQRIGRIAGEILAHAAPVEVLGMFGTQKQHPKNVGATVVYRRWLPYGGATTNSNTINRWVVDAGAHQLNEGVTPDADTLTPQDITVSLQEYGCLYALTNRTVDLSEDDVPAEMKKQCGERIGLVREMIRYGVVKGGTNVYYSNGSSRAAVNSKVNLNGLRRISRNLQANHAQRITSVLSMSPDFGSTGVEASYVVIAHTDCEADIRDLANFKNVAEYGQRKTISPYEIGSCENFRFILSPELAAYADAGGSGLTNGVYCTTSTTAADVYPMIVCGEDAWGQVALRGGNALSPTYIPPGQKTKDDPLGQRGFIGASFYMNCVRLNEGWMAVYEVAISNLA